MDETRTTLSCALTPRLPCLPLDSPISDRPRRTNQPAMIKNSESGIGVGRFVSGFDSCRPGQRVGTTGRSSVAGQGAFPKEQSQDQGLILDRFGEVVAEAERQTKKISSPTLH